MVIDGEGDGDGDPVDHLSCQVTNTTFIKTGANTPARVDNHEPAHECLSNTNTSQMLSYTFAIHIRLL